MKKEFLYNGSLIFLFIRLIIYYYSHWIGKYVGIQNIEGPKDTFEASWANRLLRAIRRLFRTAYWPQTSQRGPWVSWCSKQPPELGTWPSRGLDKYPENSIIHYELGEGSGRDRPQAEPLRLGCVSEVKPPPHRSGESSESEIRWSQNSAGILCSQSYRLCPINLKLGI